LPFLGQTNKQDFMHYELRTLKNNKLVRENFSSLELLVSHLKTTDLKDIIGVYQVEVGEKGPTSTQLSFFIEGDLAVLESPKQPRR
jgi:hypothetical protein